jgi:hypothetical protein
MVNWVQFDPAVRSGAAMDPEGLARAAEAFSADGVLVIENVLEPALADRLSRAFLRRYRRYLTQRDHHDALTVGDLRYMVTVKIEPPFADPEVYANPLLLPLLGEVLGEVRLQNFGVVVSLPGAAAQYVHRDGPELFGTASEQSLPTYAVTVAIPLVDADEQTGTTSVWPGSHRASSFDHLEPVEPYVTRGTAILWDYRVRHGGQPNRTSEPRPLLYLTYARPWFQDARNFSKQAPLVMSARERRRIPEQYATLFPPLLESRSTRMRRGLRTRLGRSTQRRAREAIAAETLAADAGPLIVAARRAGIETVEVEPESLAFDPTGTTCVPMNATAALVWACLDGTATVEDISRDLAEGLDAPLDVVRADVTSLVREFVARGIAVDERSAMPADNPRSATPPQSDERPLGDVLSLNALAISGHNRAILVDRALRGIVEESGDELAQAGWHLADPSKARVDCSRFEVLLAEGRVEVTRILLREHGTAPDHASPSQRLAGLLRLLTDLGTPIDPRDVELLSKLAATVDVRWISGSDRHELTTCIAELRELFSNPSPLPPS